ncbi:MAG: adenylate/guanylate cyclase domain-containing protein [Alphaproteobacteria bacterium]
MPTHTNSSLRLEIGHVLFIDIVGYSALLINEQTDLLAKLNDVVRGTEHFRSAEAEGRLVRLPTGDGMALVFRNSPEEPVRCALEISRALKEHPKLRVRMGIHSGPVNEVADVNERANVAGAGINIAQRVMDCGDAGHILLSRHVAEDLQHYPEWRTYLHNIGECEVKHSETISIVNFYSAELGNPNPPRLKRGKAQLRRRRRNVLLLAGSSMVALVIAAIFLMPRASARKVDKSVAVLPFENLSDDKANAYFADGIQDDVLTNLSKIGDLRVISRTSVMQYRGRPTNLREIGKALGVSNILEGSVRRSGNKVRVNVQLIDANTDEHIWANDYDRDVTDVFAIQSDLAQSIAEALQAKLSPGEKSQMTRKPTENGEAYLAFVQAHDLSCAYESSEKLKQSEQLYQRAIELDPNFALAIARYSQLESWMVHDGDRSPERRNKARSLAERALQLQPDLPEAHLAIGFSYYYGDNDYDAALKEFEIAQRGLPNESEVYLAIGAIQRRQGKWAESTANLEKAVSLNPKDTWPLQNLAFNYGMQRNFAAANKAIDRALALDPSATGPWYAKVEIALSEKGDVGFWEQALEKMKTFPMTDEQRLKLVGVEGNLLLFERKYPQLLQLAATVPDDSLATDPELPGLKYFAIGIAQKQLGDETAADSAFAKAKNIYEDQLKRKPDDPKVHVQLAKVLAWMGDRDAAIAHAQRAADLRPESKDAFDGPKTTEDVAQVYAILGDSGRAVELLDGLLSRTTGVTLESLRANPAWDPIRNDPAFRALFTKYAGKA